MKEVKMEAINEDIKQIKEQVEMIYQELRMIKIHNFDVSKSLIKLCMGQSNDKVETIKEIAMNKGSINVNEVMTLFDITREPALKYLKKLGKIKSFTFYTANRTYKLSSRVIYTSEQIMENEINDIKKYVISEGSALFETIRKFMGFSGDDAYAHTRTVAEKIVERYPDEFRIDDDRELVYKINKD